MKDKLILIIILFLAFFFRFYGFNWDNGYHLHPDERAIVMFSLPLQFPNSLSEFLSTSSRWNPHFFAYGSFPLYLLKIAGDFFGTFNPKYASYDGLNLVGRMLSVFFELGTIIILSKIGSRLFNKKIGLLSSFFYGLSVLAIQSSHFYIVDPILTFFITLFLYQLLAFYKNPTFKKAVILGIIFGLSLATKNSASVLIISLSTAMLIDFLLIFLRAPHRIQLWSAHLPKILKLLLTDGFAILVSTILTFFILEPYALIDFKNFWLQTSQQFQMTHNAFTFPYTLQYVGKTPYLYEIKNIFLWGQGPVIAFSCFVGFFYFIYKLFDKQMHCFKEKLIILSFFLAYFITVGNFAIGFMRYMLPLYPLLCLFGAFLIYSCSNYLRNRIKNKMIFLIINFLFFISMLIWPLSFMQIYKSPNTRVLASDWINKKIKPNATLAVEHWDDSLPLFGQENYKMLTLEIYNPDTPEKWVKINSLLAQTDYLLLASNRLYTPLQKLTDCQKLPSSFCYPLTAFYYKNLFAEKYGFKKILEFENYPTIPLLNIKINDQSADESFQVYDHPKVIIFKKETSQINS